VRVPRPAALAVAGVLGLAGFAALWVGAGAAVPVRAAVPVQEREAAQVALGARQPREGPAERGALLPAPPVQPTN
jgi:hypothetical protein